MSNIQENNTVIDRLSFIQFVESLKNELDSDNQWENITLSDFLEAMSRYASDIQGYYNNTRQDINADLPSWNLFADILRGATIYE
jgi:deoxyadenosine/deoxycytidine kinase